MAAVSTLSGNTGGERMLKFYHTHTGDTLQVVYFRQGEYDTRPLINSRSFWPTGAMENSTILTHN